MIDYFCTGAEGFDSVLRETPGLAQELFEEARPFLQPGATVESVRFDEECENPHLWNYTIKFVVIRRPGNDVHSLRFAELTPPQQQGVRFAHEVAHRHCY